MFRDESYGVGGEVFLNLGSRAWKRVFFSGLKGIAGFMLPPHDYVYRLWGNISNAIEYLCFLYLAWNNRKVDKRLAHVHWRGEGSVQIAHFYVSINTSYLRFG